MAVWTGTARSNYFAVKDLQAFREAVDREIPDVDIQEGDPDGEYRGKVCLIVGRDSDSGGWPSTRYDEEADDDVDVDIVKTVQPHLVDDEIVVLMEVGSERTKYVTGEARAFSTKGDPISISLNDIYALAAQSYGKPPTPAQY